MSVIVRYILRELGVTFLFGFVAITSLLLIVGLVQKAMDDHLPFITIVQLVPYVFAEMNAVSLPVALLLAVTIFFARMSGNNEITALKALGIPPRDFLIPVFVIAVFFSVICVGINELAITKGRAGFSAIIDSSVENILIGQLREKKQFVTRNNQVTILVKGVDDQNRLIEPRIISKKESATLSARTAQISIDLNKDLLTLTFNDLRVVGDIISFAGGNDTFSIPLSEIIPPSSSNKASNLGLDQVGEERKNTIEQIAQQRRTIAAHRTFAACMGSVDNWNTPQIVEARAEILRLQKQYNRLSTEPPRRWASGFSCFFFVCLGAPLAIWMRKSDFFASFFACFVPILLLYYPLLTFGLNQAKNGTLPPMCVWTANIGIGLIGLWFIRQIHRY